MKIFEPDITFGLNDGTIKDMIRNSTVAKKKKNGYMKMTESRLTKVQPESVK